MTAVASLAAAGPACAADALAGATFRHSRHWNTQLFVTPMAERSAAEYGDSRLQPHPIVGARLTGRLSKSLRVHFEVNNVLDQQPGGPAFQPAEPRGFGVRVTKTFR